MNKLSCSQITVYGKTFVWENFYSFWGFHSIENVLLQIMALLINNIAKSTKLLQHNVYCEWPFPTQNTKFSNLKLMPRTVCLLHAVNSKFM